MTAKDAAPSTSPLLLLEASCWSQKLYTIYFFIFPLALLATMAMTSELKRVGVEWKQNMLCA